MKVSIETARQMLKEIYAAKGANAADAEWLTELALEQDLTGNYFSGLAESPEGVYGSVSPDTHEAYEVDKPALKLINGNGRPAKLIMRTLLPEAVKWAKEQGQVVIGFKNCGYHGALGTIARKFAEADMVCVYSANGGPATVPPYGGTRALFGTNPIAYGIPTSGSPIVFDAATSERPFGSIAKAQERNELLQANTYYDGSGGLTTDPDKAAAITSFGGYKGSAVNLLLDVLTGALVGAKSGMLVVDDGDIGGFLLVIDPAAFGPLQAFKDQANRLCKDILKSPPADGMDTVRYPGLRADQLRERQLQDGVVEVEDMVWQKFGTLHRRLTKAAG